MSKSRFKIISFYKFIRIKEPSALKSSLDHFLKDKLIRGTIILANEGINASISGRNNDLQIVVETINSLLRNKTLNIKENYVSYLPFNRIKVRLKKEIVALGKTKIDVPKYTGKLIPPKDWNKVIKKKNIKLIDTRNNYEFDIGHFKNAINPKTKSFREFPKKISQLGVKKSDEIVMYCTGGIRCEKISAFLNKQGYKSISQLEGGILNYLEFSKKRKGEDAWNGECFVFDNRVTVNKELEAGNYDQCYGCRHPITRKDKKLKSYKKGVCCKYCIDQRSDQRKKRSETRQNQIQRAESRGLNHSFKRILD
tara:strand:+ start:2823 stop:3752 length:930 start_codon:yes stop_codon:yes gene_type:complete